MRHRRAGKSAFYKAYGRYSKTKHWQADKALIEDLQKSCKTLITGIKDSDIDYEELEREWIRGMERIQDEQDEQKSFVKTGRHSS